MLETLTPEILTNVLQFAPIHERINAARTNQDMLNRVTVECSGLWQSIDFARFGRKPNDKAVKSYDDDSDENRTHNNPNGSKSPEEQDAVCEESGGGSDSDSNNSSNSETSRMNVTGTNASLTDNMLTSLLSRVNAREHTKHLNRIIQFEASDCTIR